MADNVDLATAMAFVQAGLTTHSDAEMALMTEMQNMIVKAVADFRVAQGVDVDPNASAPEPATEDTTQSQSSSW